MKVRLFMLKNEYLRLHNAQFTKIVRVWQRFAKNLPLLKKLILKAQQTLNQKKKETEILCEYGERRHRFDPTNQRRYFKLLRSPEIDIKKSIQPAYVACAGILEQSMGARNRVGIGISY